MLITTIIIIIITIGFIAQIYSISRITDSDRLQKQPVRSAKSGTFLAPEVTG